MYHARFRMIESLNTAVNDVKMCFYFLQFKIMDTSLTSGRRGLKNWWGRSQNSTNPFKSLFYRGGLQNFSGKIPPIL